MEASTMKKMSLFILALFTLSFSLSGCGGSGSSTSTVTGATVLITGSVKSGASVSTTSTYDGVTFDAAPASVTLTSTVFPGALFPSSVTVNSIDVTYIPLEYDATNHLYSPAIGTVYHRSIGGVIPAGGKLDLTDIVIFSEVVGAQNNAAITTLLNNGFDLPYSATVTFNMNEDATNTPMKCTVTFELHLLPA
jgi:hypothetical protein